MDISDAIAIIKLLLQCLFNYGLAVCISTNIYHFFDVILV